jgi:metal-responsive CopG/Arc/MetJ family transcriptional regulator
MKRGSVQKTESELVALWIPKQLLEALDDAVNREDSDRSKFIRNALRSKLHIEPADRTPQEVA